MRKVNLIPMAGSGQRFIDKGYSVPKPLIDVNGLPMVVRAAQSLPEADRWIFICRRDHIEHYKIDKIIKKYFSEPIIISFGKFPDTTFAFSKAC